MILNEGRQLELGQEGNFTPASSSTSTSSGQVNCVTSNGRGCNCVQVVNESRAIVKELEVIIRELEVENASLTGKLTQLLRVCTSLRAKVNNSSNSKSNKSEKGQNQWPKEVKGGQNNTSESTTRPDTTASVGGLVDLSEKMSKETLDKASQTSNSYSLSSLLTSSAVSCTEKCTLNSTDTGIFSACSSATEVQSNSTTASDARQKESTAQMPLTTTTTTSNTPTKMALAMSTAEDVIQQLRHRIKKLEKELDSKDASYADLLKKYEMRKQLHTDTVTRLR